MINLHVKPQYEGGLRSGNLDFDVITAVWHVIQSLHKFDSIGPEL